MISIPQKGVILTMIRLVLCKSIRAFSIVLLILAFLACGHGGEQAQQEQKTESSTEEAMKQDRGEPSQAFTVVSVSTLPGKSNDELLLGIFRKDKEGLQSLDVVHERHQTFGEAVKIKEIATRLQDSTRTLSLFLDAHSAAALAPQIRTPWIAVVRSKEMLLPGGSSANMPSNKAWILETMPTPGDLVQAIRRLHPLPRDVGMVYTPAAPGSSGFVEKTTNTLQSIFAGHIQVHTCVLAPGACRNATDVRNALENSFPSLPKGSLLLVLPDANTLKFAFVFRNFAVESGIGLVGLGDFNPGNTAFDITVPTEALSQQCRRVLTFLSEPNHEKGIELPALQTRVAFHPKVLQRLGFSTVEQNGQKTNSK